MKLNKIKSIIAGLCVSMLWIGAADARAPEIYLGEGGLFENAWDYALNGYDAVAYFSLAEGAPPIAGADRYTTIYKGAVWRFESQENLEKFIAAPEQYAPQFGGYCAWALARDKLAKGDPARWTVYQGKLYLNFDKGTQRSWRENIDRDIARGKANWPDILDRN